MNNKNSQILLIENVLSNINESINEKDELLQNSEDENRKLKSTITTLKHECKTAFSEHERLEEVINDLKKQNLFLSEELKIKNEDLNIKLKELDSVKLQHKDFMDQIEKRIEDFKQELENKNSIILELENINKELNQEIHSTRRDKNATVSKLERKLEKEEFRNFINTDNDFSFKSSSYDLSSVKKKASLQLDKLENKLKTAKKDTTPTINMKKPLSSEEDILKKNLGF